MENPVNIREESTTTVPAVAPKRKLPLQYIIGAVFLLLVVIGGGIAFYLSNQSQDIRQQASTGGSDYESVPPGGTCIPPLVPFYADGPSIVGCYNPNPTCIANGTLTTTGAASCCSKYAGTVLGVMVCSAPPATNCWSKSDSCAKGTHACDATSYPNASACTVALNTTCWSTSNNCASGTFNCQTAGSYANASACTVALNSKCWSTSNNCASGTFNCQLAGSYNTASACTVALNTNCWSTSNSCASGTFNCQTAGTYPTAAACTVGLNSTCWSTSNSCASGNFNCQLAGSYTTASACTVALNGGNCWNKSDNCAAGNHACSLAGSYTTASACTVAINTGTCYNTSDSCTKATHACDLAGSSSTIAGCTVKLNGGGQCWSTSNSCQFSQSCTSSFPYFTQTDCLVGLHPTQTCLANTSQTCQYSSCGAAGSGTGTCGGALLCCKKTSTSTSCAAGTCVNGKRCEYDPLSGGGYIGTHTCTTAQCRVNQDCSSSEYCSDNGACVNKLGVGNACNSAAKCASGTCTNGVCTGTGTNISCTTDATCPSGFTCNQTTHKCGQSTGTPPINSCATGTKYCSSSRTCIPNANTCPPASACATGGQSCESTCCATGFVCQGSAGSRLCQVQNPTDCAPTDHCGGTNGYIGFKCTSLTSTGECLSNPQTFSTFEGAAAYAGSCGQADTVCAASRNLCGGFTVFKSGCSGTSNPPNNPTTPPTTPPSTPPGVSPTPTTPPVVPVCLNVTASKANPAIGDSVTFTCGLVTGADHYQFRIKLPNGTIQTLAAATAKGQTSVPFTVASSGSHTAQCRICTGADDSTCQAYGSL